jgi:GTP cyclohydrolase I
LVENAITTQPTRDYKKIEEGVSLVLQGLGVDITDHNFKGTPRRVAKVYREMFDPPKTEWPVFDEKFTDMVMFRGFVFHTMCPHHMLPVELTSTVAYIPDGKVIGASKLGRIHLEANRYPMTQERLTFEVLHKINELTAQTASGAAIIMRGAHGCFRIRGLHTQADMLTIRFAGCFEADELLQQRFLNMAMMR